MLHSQRMLSLQVAKPDKSMLWIFEQELSQANVALERLLISLIVLRIRQNDLMQILCRKSTRARFSKFFAFASILMKNSKKQNQM